MNALFVLRPAKLWAFNFGHPCPPSKKGEVLLLGQAEPTMVGIVPHSHHQWDFPHYSLLFVSKHLYALICLHIRTIPLAFRRVRVCVCFLVSHPCETMGTHAKASLPCLPLPLHRPSPFVQPLQKNTYHLPCLPLLLNLSYWFSQRF